MNEELAYVERPRLLRIIAEQEEQLAMLQGQLATAQAQVQVQQLVARVVELEHRDPPAWAKPNRPKPAEPRPARKQRTRHFARRRETPTQTIRHVAARCPDCNAELRDGRVCGRRQVIELPMLAATVTEHVVVRRWCAQCQRAVTPALDLSDQVLGQHRVGLRLMGVIAYLREQQRRFCRPHPSLRLRGSAFRHRQPLSVNDQATSVFMTSFYSHLQAGMSKAAALQAAEADTRAEYPNPYYWAAFVLTGDPGSGP